MGKASSTINSTIQTLRLMWENMSKSAEVLEIGLKNPRSYKKKKQEIVVLKESVDI